MFAAAAKNFFRHRRGSVLPTFAIAAIPLIVATGGVVDYTNAYDQKMMVQDAMDSAALAAGKKIGLLTMEELEQDVDNYYAANLGGKISDPPPLATDVNISTITLTTVLRVPTYFLGMIGLNEIVFDLKSQATLALGTLEVVMALDNSGSMNTDNNIATLRTAATNLTNTLYNLGVTSTKPDPVKVGLVPFAAAVNVGPSNSNAAWIDQNAKGTYHADAQKTHGAPATTSNFDLFNRISNASWGGCVEVRPMPYDVTDDAATTVANPSTEERKTLFVPLFAPDEPDNLTCTTSLCSYTGSGSQRRYKGAPTGSRSYNNYLADAGGTCGDGGSQKPNWTCSNGNVNCGGSGIGKSEEQAFGTQTSCKYGTTASKVTAANVTVGGIPGGPNFMCTTTALTAMTTDQDGVLNSIAGMVAEGATNIQEGLMWAWRLLSPTPPYIDGHEYTVNDNQKILILMTDGFNTYYPNSSFLKSWYAAWGYVSEGHLGTTSTSQSTLIDKMNERTALACQNVKAAGITVYTVSFQVDDEDTLAMMSACATDPAMAYVSTSQSALLAAFSAIGDEITLLRISQ